MKKTAQLFLSLSSIALSSMAINQTIFADDISTGVINEAMVDEEKAVDVTHSNSTDLTNLNDEKISKSTTDTSLEEEKAIVKTRETVFNKEIALDKNEVNELVKNKKVSLDAKEEKEPKISQNDVMYNEVYKAAVIFGQYSIDTRPWGEEGFQKIGDTSLYTNKIVDIIGENKDGYYKLVKMNEENLGWIDHRAFGRIDATTVARIGKGSYSVDTQPWGMEGYKKINETDHLLGKEVKVVSQKQNKEYSYVLVDDKPYGWVDNRALISKEEPYDSWIINPNFSIDNAPWGERNFKKRDTSNRYVNERIKVLGVNQTKTYYLVADQQGKTLGWVDHRALSNANYTAQIIRGDNFSIDTRPWGTPGYKRAGLAKNHLYSNVQVIGVTSDKLYMLVLKDNKVLGWLDNRALSKREGYKTVILNLDALVTIKPENAPNNQTVKHLNQNNKIVEVIGENSEKSSILIKFNDGRLGWIKPEFLGYPVNSKILSLENQRVFDRLKNLYDYKHQTLDQIINDYLRRKNIPSKNLTLSYVNLITDDQFDWNGSDLIYGASTYKLPLSMVLTDLISENKLTYNHLVTIHPQDIIYGGEGYWIGQRVPLGQLMEDSIVNSNNTASFALMTYLRHNFGMINELNKRYSKEPISVTGRTEGSTTSKYQADVLRSLYKNEQKYSKIIKDLKRATPGQYMQRYIPNEVAHKYGQLHQYWSSTGITYSQIPYAAAIYTKYISNAERLIGEINALLYHYTNERFK